MHCTLVCENLFVVSIKSVCEQQRAIYDDNNTCKTSGTPQSNTSKILSIRRSNSALKIRADYCVMSLVRMASVGARFIRVTGAIQRDVVGVRLRRQLVGGTAPP